MKTKKYSVKQLLLAALVLPFVAYIFLPEPTGLNELSIYIGGLVLYLFSLGLVYKVSSSKTADGRIVLRNSVGVGIMSGFVSISALVIFILIFSLTKVDQIGTELTEIADEDMPLIESLTQIETHQLEQAINFEKAMKFAYADSSIENSRMLLEKAEDEFLSNGKFVDEKLHEAVVMAEHIGELALDEETIKDFNEIAKQIKVIEKEHSDYENHVEEVFSKLNSGQVSVVAALTEKIEQEQGELNHEIELFVRNVQLATDSSVHHAKAAEKATFSVILIVGPIIVLLGLFIGFSNTNRLVKPIITVAERVEQLRSVCITNLGNGLESLANGDVNQKVEYGTELLNMEMENEVGDIARSVDKMILQAQGGIDAFEKTREKLTALISETEKLIDSAKNGELDARGNTTDFEGAYRQLVSGINDTLDAIIEPINEGSKVLEIMATGDLTVKVIGDYKGDHQKIKNSINNVGNAIGALIDNVTQAVEATASASSEISSGTEEMAAGAQEQSAQTGEVASAIGEMARTVIDTSNIASSAAEAASNTKAKAQSGMVKVDENKSGIERIMSSAQATGEIITSLAGKTDQIGDIAQVIDDIADQTNLLALNAAIEAARAGEQGRGFAVVADEVRKLAERTTKATKEIAETIKAIQGEAKDADNSMNEARESVMLGMTLTEETREVFNSILSDTEELSNQISQVAAASEEQSAGAEQISRNIEGITNITHESAAAIQQVASTAEDLNRLTENLQNLISQFKVETLKIITMVTVKTRVIWMMETNILLVVMISYS